MYKLTFLLFCDKKDETKKGERMFFFDFVRIFLAVAWLMIATVVICPAAIVLGFLVYPVSRVPVISIFWRILQRASWLWNCSVWQVSCRIFLRMKIHVEWRVPKLVDDEVTILIANHPTYIGFLGYGRFVTGILWGNVVMVMKSELKKSFSLEGILAKTLWALGAALFIDRENPTKARNQIKEWVSKGGAKGKIIGIFPDGRRPSKDRLHENHDRYRKDIPDVDEKFSETLVPKPGGTYVIFNACRELGLPVRLYRATMAFDREDSGFRSIRSLIGATYKVRCSDETDTALRLRGERVWKGWFYSMWEEINLTLKEWKDH